MDSNYRATIFDLAFGTAMCQLQFDDIIETEDGWTPIEKKYRTVYYRGKELGFRNDSMKYRKFNAQ